MKPDTSDIQTGTSNLDDVTRGAGGKSSAYSNANSGGDDVHSVGYKPGSPSMAGSAGSELNPGFEGDVAESGGGPFPTRIMEGGVEYDWPGSGQGSLEKLKGGGIKGA